MKLQQPTHISRIEALDGIRGIAVLMVMVFHYWQHDGFASFPLPSKVFNVAVFGQTGVDLFFVLSGFLITRILIAARGQDNYFKNFYVRRSLRIFPLYFGFLALSCFVLPVLEGKPMLSFADTWWYWFFLQNIPATFSSLTVGPGHFWSLAVEEHFYLVWPAIVYFIPLKFLTRISVGLVFSALIIRFFFIYHTDIGVFYFTLCRIDSLAMGAFLACLEKQINLYKYRYWFLFILGITLPTIVILWSLTSGDANQLNQVFKYLFIAVVYFSTIGIVVTFKHFNFINKYLANTPLIFTGTISYSLYIFHSSCYKLIFKFISPDRSPAICLALSFTLAYLISWLSYRYFELHFLKLKKYFTSVSES